MSAPPVQAPAAPLPRLRNHAAIPYVLPFAIFLFFLAIQDYVPLDERIEFPLRFFMMSAVLWFVSRGVIDLRIRNFAASTVFGFAVFAVWVAPDLLWPGYREHWLFQNSVTGTLNSSIAEGWRTHLTVLVFRTLRAVVIVSIVEELFWRGWLMRWLISPDFQKVSLGAYGLSSFWITAALFASEHGPFWDVGLIAGAAYNWWIIRTKSLGDCIYAHAVTNACLCAFTIVTQRWEYWL